MTILSKYANPFLVLVVGAGLAFSNPTFADESEWNVESLMEALSKVEHARLEFSETKRSIFLVTDIVIEGTMEYRAPDYVERNTTSPTIEKVTIQGDQMTIEKTVEPGKVETLTRVQQYSVQSHPLLKATVESIRALLAGNFDLLKSNYDMQLEGSRESWSMDLIPKDEVILEHIEKIELSGQDTMVGEIVTIQADGDESTMKLSYLLLQ